MGPTGSISGPQYFPSNSTGQIIPAAASATSPSTLDSTLTIPSYGGTFTVADITVQLGAAFPTDSGLSAVLIAPNGTKVTLFSSGVLGSGSNFVNTVFDDAAENSITSGTAPYTGTFKPTGQLSSLIGKTVDMKNSAHQWVAGTWTLQVTNSLPGVSGMLDNWSLNITPVITVTPATPGTTTQFTVGFPQQQLSGTYTIQLGPTIQDTFGDQMDTTQTAGLNVLRDQDQNGPTTTVHYGASDLPKAIPAPDRNNSRTGDFHDQRARQFRHPGGQDSIRCQRHAGADQPDLPHGSRPDGNADPLARARTTPQSTLAR